MPSAAPSVETCAERRKHVDHIPHEIIRSVFRIRNHDTPPPCTQRRLQGLDPKTGVDAFLLGPLRELHEISLPYRTYVWYPDHILDAPDWQPIQRHDSPIGPWLRPSCQRLVRWGA